MAARSVEGVFARDLVDARLSAGDFVARARDEALDLATFVTLVILDFMVVVRKPLPLVTDEALEDLCVSKVDAALGLLIPVLGAVRIVVVAGVFDLALRTLLAVDTTLFASSSSPESGKSKTSVLDIRFFLAAGSCGLAGLSLDLWGATALLVTFAFNKVVRGATSTLPVAAGLGLDFVDRIGTGCILLEVVVFSFFAGTDSTGLFLFAGAILTAKSSSSEGTSYGSLATFVLPLVFLVGGAILSSPDDGKSNIAVSRLSVAGIRMWLFVG